jgi:hypothetical protein
VDAYASRYPDDWRELVVDAGGTETAEESAVVGALGAALREARTPDQLALDLLDDDGDPAHDLALAIDGTNLWSIDESAGLDEVLASLDPDLDEDVYEVLWTAMVERVAERLWTDLHACRLTVLVRRLRSRLRELEPRAGEILGRACAAFESDPALPQRLGALLLSNTLGPLFRLNLSFAAAV